jgi:hypothetical protein
MARMLAGQFPDRRSAERALAALRAGGFDPQRVSLVSQEHVEGAPPPQAQATHSASWSVIGALIGAIVGGLIAWLTTSLVHSVTSVTTTGVIVCAIVGGAIGWFVGGLAGSGRPLEEGEYRQERVELGRMQLTLDPGEREEEARDIFQRFGARNVHEMDDMQRADRGSAGDSQQALT